MSWLFFAILAYFIAAIVSVLDKVILEKAIPRPASFAAWTGIFGIFSLILLPFGFELRPLLENPGLLLLSLGSGASLVVGLYFLFSAISINEVSRIVPFFGALVAIFTLIIGTLLGVETLDNIQLFAFFLLFLGSMIISIKFQEIKALSLKSIVFSTIGALLFGLSFILLKSAFLKTAFLNAFIAASLGEVAAGLILLGFFTSEPINYKISGLFALNKSLAGLFTLLQNYAIFLGSAALVQAISGTRYIFLLAMATLSSFKYPKILEEKFSGKAFLVKSAAVLIMFGGLAVLALRERPADLASGLKTFGVTFSKKAAIAFGLDWQKTYLAILDDLGARKIRLAAYWDEEVEDLDWQIREAEKRGAKIILAVGERLPRWPECHIPKWAGNLPEKERQDNLLNFIELIVSRYKSSPAIEYWQVENEPFLPGFGECPPLDKGFLDRELALARFLDSRPIIVSASGELDPWLSAAKQADIFGTTMYRIIYSAKIPGGYLKYPLPPSFFHLKANLAKIFAGVKDIIVVELQAEPWGPRAVWEMTAEERDISLSLEQFKENISYARAVGFRSAYLWGVEWWYWEKFHDRSEFWDYAKTLFIENNDHF